MKINLLLATIFVPKNDGGCVRRDGRLSRVWKKGWWQEGTVTAIPLPGPSGWRGQLMNAGNDGLTSDRLQYRTHRQGDRHDAASPFPLLTATGQSGSGCSCRAYG